MEACAYTIEKSETKKSVTHAISHEAPARKSFFDPGKAVEIDEEELEEISATDFKAKKSYAKEENINYVCLTPENIEKYIPISEIPPNYYKLKHIAHRADFIRALVLYYHGGLWLDADVLRINTMKPLLEDLNTADWVVFGNKEQKFSISVFAVRKSSPFLKEWIDQMTAIIKRKSDIKWTEIGYDLLYPLWKIWDKKFRKKYYINTDTCYPILWNNWKKFFEIGNCDFLYRKFQPVIVFYNEMFTNDFKQISYDEFENFINNSDTVIANLFKNTIQ